MIPVDSIELDEPDSLPIGANFFIARDALGRTYVNDIAHRRVLLFSGTGRLVRTFGRPGRGPGEFVLPGVMGLIADDSVLVVSDVGKRALSVFGVSSGRFLRQANLPVQDIGQNWMVGRDTVVFAAHLAQAAIVKWDWRTDAVLLVGSTPPALLAEMPTALRYGRSEIAETDSGFVAFLTESAHVSIRRPALPGPPWRFPPRGGFGGLDFRAAEKARGAVCPAPRLGSAALHRQASGSLVVLFLDFEQVAEDLPTMGRSDSMCRCSCRASDEVCVDGLVPIETDVLPLPAFRAIRCSFCHGS
ncbi:MAG: 6-bladed beta-propeller [Gemmatimonadales bacterium]